MFHQIAMTDRDLLVVAFAIYGCAFLYGLSFLLLRRPYSRVAMLIQLSCGFFVQTLGLNLRGTTIKAWPLGNPFEVAQFIAWSLVLLFLIIGPAFRLRLLGFLTAGLTTLIAGGSLAMHSWDHPYPLRIFGSNPWIEIHAALAIFSYSIFAILSLISFMFLVQRHGLKKKQFRGIYQILPSVQQLDLMAKRLLFTGVLFLSASLIFGAVFWANNFDLVPVFKLTATCIIWIGYLCVFTLRMQRKLVTRRHAIATIILFIMALFSLWPVESARGPELIDKSSVAPQF